MIKEIGKAILGLAYPLTCRICRVKLTENTALCKSCISKIQTYEYGTACCRYEGVLKEALHLFKYKGVHSLINTFSQFIFDFIDKNFVLKDIDIIIPIPLYSTKERERGYNQAYLLSVPISKKYNVPIYTNHLIKKLATRPQSNLNRTQRLNNLKGAFSVKHAHNLQGKIALVVDDVYTTGTTIREACRVLKQAGLKKIKVLALARGQ